MHNTVSIAIIIASFAVLWFSLRVLFFKKVKDIEKRLFLLEKEFEIVKERSRSNLRVYRKVVDGLDDIIGHMKTSVEEEEKKVALIKVNEHDATAHIENTLQQTT